MMRGGKMSHCFYKTVVDMEGMLYKLLAVSRNCGARNLKLFAKEFVDLFLRGETFSMLAVTAPFEKSRVETDAFFKDLKYYTAQTLRNNPNGYRAPLLSRLYTLLCELEKSLVTNINLSLLFCTLVSRAEQITNNR